MVTFVRHPTTTAPPHTHTCPLGSSTTLDDAISIQRAFSFHGPLQPHNFAFSRVMGMGTEGLVAVATCTLPDFPAPHKRFAVKVVLNIYGMSTQSLARRRELEEELALRLPKVGGDEASL